MSPETLTAHIASQILDPSIFVKRTLASAVPFKNASAPPTLTPSPPLDSPQLSSLALAETLVLPKRLSNFLNFVSSFDAQYRKNFKSACTDLAILETISVLPYGALEDEVQAWIEEQIPELNFTGVDDKNKNLYMKVMLNTTISGIQIGLLMGISILRSALTYLRQAFRGEMLKWIEEGEDFVADLECLREGIGERYSAGGVSVLPGKEVPLLHLNGEEVRTIDATGKDGILEEEAVPQLLVNEAELEESHATPKEFMISGTEIFELDASAIHVGEDTGRLSSRTQTAHDMSRMSLVFWENNKLHEKLEVVKERSKSVA
ncbi:uncharacterized protein PAC_15378 [Phialocephala subalpina]|uniref:Uncharacterized protein n=1 Tax=Phialocephala subalpina TaxID=576137 RepID=A0A1L7XKD4_9HELO|nr:uncharacterized protein PAC_15378 [Phialocephala subalpina]